MAKNFSFALDNGDAERLDRLIQNSRLTKQAYFEKLMKEHIEELEAGEGDGDGA